MHSTQTASGSYSWIFWNKKLVHRLLFIYMYNCESVPSWFPYHLPIVSVTTLVTHSPPSISCIRLKLSKIPPIMVTKEDFGMDKNGNHSIQDNHVYMEEANGLSCTEWENYSFGRQWHHEGGWKSIFRKYRNTRKRTNRSLRDRENWN